MKLLDTSAVVDIDRGGVDRKVRKLDEQSRNAISMVTVTELRLGVDLQAERGTDHHQQALDDLDRLLARFDILPISRPVRGGSDVDATPPPTDRTVSGPPPTEQQYHCRQDGTVVTDRTARDRKHDGHATISTPEISKRVPPSALSRTRISQPWASTICRTIANPRPVPPSVVE